MSLANTLIVLFLLTYLLTNNSRSSFRLLLLPFGTNYLLLSGSLKHWIPSNADYKCTLHLTTRNVYRYPPRACLAIARISHSTQQSTALHNTNVFIVFYDLVIVGHVSFCCRSIPRRLSEWGATCRLLEIKTEFISLKRTICKLCWVL